MHLAPEIDLNCDMGEGYGAWGMGHDEDIMPLITSANVACGSHAGDPNVMAATVKLARAHGVAVGAHPGYPDLAGFGRRVIPLAPGEIERWVLFQIGALHAIARAEGVEISHVKPHGALYNAAARDRTIAGAIVDAIRSFSTNLLLYCPPGSEMSNVASSRGITIVKEGFADRAYEPDGSLTNRSIEGAVYDAPEQGVQQALQLAEGWVSCRDGTRLKLEVKTICVHSDTPGAADFMRKIRNALESRGKVVQAPHRHGE